MGQHYLLYPHSFVRFSKNLALHYVRPRVFTSLFLLNQRGVGMKIIVQKFGGTSVKDAKSRNLAFLHVKKAIEEGYKVVVVVSAIGRNKAPYATDTLLGLIDPAVISKREQDILLSCGEKISAVVFSNYLNKNGIKAAALTGQEAGILTNGEHTNAKIINVKTDALYDNLRTYDAVVVAGFQGYTVDGSITTLGRGGSDTTACALGAALHAEWIDIFTDVEGIMTADPRIVEEARAIPAVTYEEICNMAYQGAKVIHPRAVEIAMRAQIPIRVRSTSSQSLGTLVTSLNSGKALIIDRVVTGITYVANVSQIKIEAKNKQYNLHRDVFKAMAEQEISVDFINISPMSIVYTVMRHNLQKAVTILQNMGYDVNIMERCAKIAAVGAGMNGVPGVTSIIVEALTNEGIQILQSADSHTTIWVLVKEEDMKIAVKALHRAFQLEKS